ncbi:MAG TPA: isochorismatase family protein [Ignavibacteriaceae bacterium]|nr:isochorismatase family protein [Ignavibacteriaceae bacterium]
MSEVRRFNKLLKPEKTGLLIIDIQERILPVINNHQIVVDNTLKLIKGFKVLGLPIYFTEQYPKGLGPTAKVILDELAEIKPFDKMSFSCSGAGDLFEDFQKKNLSQIVVCGIEAHVCVQQTVLDLVENNIQVNLAADAVSSRKEIDYRTALERMRNHNVEVTTTESILFELLNICGTPQFKEISKLVK